MSSYVQLYDIKNKGSVFRIDIYTVNEEYVQNSVGQFLEQGRPLDAIRGVQKDHDRKIVNISGPIITEDIPDFISKEVWKKDCFIIDENIYYSFKDLEPVLFKIESQDDYEMMIELEKHIHHAKKDSNPSNDIVLQSLNYDFRTKHPETFDLIDFPATKQSLQKFLKNKFDFKDFRRY